MLFNNLISWFRSTNHKDIGILYLHKIKENFIVFFSYLRTISLSKKLILIIFLNSIFFLIVPTTIHLIYYFLIIIDLFFIVLWLKPVFFLFSLYFLICLFLYCLNNINQDNYSLYILLFLACLILLFITFFHKSLRIRLFSSFTSFSIRVFIIGDIECIFAVKGVIINNPTTSPSQIPSNYNFFDHDFRHHIPVRTEEHHVLNGNSQFFPSYANKFFHNTYIEPITHSLSNDINVIKNFKLNHGAAFSSLDDLHQSLLTFFSLQSGDFRKDGFFQTIMYNYATQFPEDTAFLANLAKYNFNRENILLLTGLLDRYDMDVVKTFQRTYGSYDGTIIVNNKTLTVDCYSPLESRPNPDYLEAKFPKNIDLIIMGNMKDDFSSFSKDRVIGVKGNSLKQVPILKDINEEIETLIHKKNNPFVIPITSGFTIPYEDFLKKYKK